MISLRFIAAFLLLARIGSDIYIFRVLQRQHALLKLPIHPALRRFRLVLYTLSIAIFVGNVVPILIDGITVAGITTGRPGNLRSISILYAMSNAITAFISAYLIHTLYRLAANDTEITEYSSHTFLDGDKPDQSDTIRADKIRGK